MNFTNAEIRTIVEGKKRKTLEIELSRSYHQDVFDNSTMTHFRRESIESLLNVIDRQDNNNKRFENSFVMEQRFQADTTSVKK